MPREKMIASTGKKVNFNESASDQMAALVIVLQRKVIELQARVEGLENQLARERTGMSDWLYAYIMLCM